MFSVTECSNFVVSRTRSKSADNKDDKPTNKAIIFSPYNKEHTEVEERKSLSSSPGSLDGMLLSPPTARYKSKRPRCATTIEISKSLGDPVITFSQGYQAAKSLDRVNREKNKFRKRSSTSFSDFSNKELNKTFSFIMRSPVSRVSSTKALSAEENRKTKLALLLSQSTGDIKDSHLFEISNGHRTAFLLSSTHVIPLNHLSVGTLSIIDETNMLIREFSYASRDKWEKFSERYSHEFKRDFIKDENWFKFLSEAEQDSLRYYYDMYFKYYQDRIHGISPPIFNPISCDISDISLAFVTVIIKDMNRLAKEDNFLQYLQEINLECFSHADDSYAADSLTPALSKTRSYFSFDQKEEEPMLGMDNELGAFFSEENILGLYDSIDVFSLEMSQRAEYCFEYNIKSLKGYLGNLSNLANVNVYSTFDSVFDSDLDEDLDSEEGCDYDEAETDWRKILFPEYYNGSHYNDPKILKKVTTNKEANLTVSQNNCFVNRILAHLNDEEGSKEKTALIVIGINHMIGAKGVIARLKEHDISVEKLSLTSGSFESYDAAPRKNKIGT
jgi:hypothetical protein